MYLLEAQTLRYQASEIPQQNAHDAYGSKYLRHHLAGSGAATDRPSRSYSNWCTHINPPFQIIYCN